MVVETKAAMISFVWILYKKLDDVGEDSLLTVNMASTSSDGDGDEQENFFNEVQEWIEYTLKTA